jgi:hypothetical protein
VQNLAAMTAARDIYYGMAITEYRIELIPADVSNKRSKSCKGMGKVDCATVQVQLNSATVGDGDTM